ncbi:MAG: ABC transporter ATP-binding protein/permease, partial [Deltaproteobacteria bacterium]|nr:ABC transporter ATP-binding protein/permease [Deltaproteobacteria bacterium]
FGHRIFTQVLATQNIFGALTEVVREHISGFKVIRAMALEDLAKKDVSKYGLLFLKKNVRLAWLMGLFFPFLNLLTHLALALTLFFGGRGVIMGEISAGDFVAFLSYLALLAWPLMALGLTLGLLQGGLASLERLAKVLEAEDPVPYPLETQKNVPALPELTRHLHDGLSIEFQNVTFCYPRRTHPALQNLSFSINSRGMTALTGPTGSGKSTLASLIPALYTPNSGQILIGGIPSTDLSLKDLRSLFCYVPQDGYTFSGSILDNVIFGKTKATVDDALRALEIACLPMDPRIFPQGIYTQVGEKGVTLSGGQKQRLALARALLLNPPYLILDDTLSAVDSKVEQAILDGLTVVREGRGTLIISHRLTTLSRAQTFLILENGNITTAGNFQKLKQEEGYFKRLLKLISLEGETNIPHEQQKNLDPAKTPNLGKKS